MSNRILIENAAQVLTCARQSSDRIGLLRCASVLVEGERIAAVGPAKDIAGLLNGTEERLDASGCVVAPGFVDCHTHVVFGGSRVDEYSVKLTTQDPAELARRGIPTGIMVTVGATRVLSEDELYEQSAERVWEMILQGTTTVESKSGYGLNLEAELKQLRVSKRLIQTLPIGVVSTFLGAHGWPADTSKEAYMDTLISEMMPEVGKSGLAEFCDVWCDDGHYDAAESARILEAGRKYGMEPKIHTGAYSYVGGADVAAGIGAVSADHLNYTPPEALRKLAQAKVTGVVLPGIDFAVRHPKPFDPRPMFDAGLELGLATNCCPGCWCTSMPLIMTLACRNHGMSPEEAIRAATYGSACAVGRQDGIGSLEVGKCADIQIWDVPRYEDVVYRLGRNPVHTLIRCGRIILKCGRLCR